VVESMKRSRLLGTKLPEVLKVYCNGQWTINWISSRGDVAPPPPPKLKLLYFQYLQRKLYF